MDEVDNRELAEKSRYESLMKKREYNSNRINHLENRITILSKTALIMKPIVWGFALTSVVTNCAGIAMTIINGIKAGILLQGITVTFRKS